MGSRFLAFALLLGLGTGFAKVREAPSGNSLGDPRVRFIDDLAEFGNRVTEIPPEPAAASWLRFVRRAFEIGYLDHPSNGPTYEAKRITEVAEAIPGPNAWPVIARMVDQDATLPRDRRLGLLLLTDVLQANYPAAEAHLRAAESMPDEPSSRLRSIRLQLALRRRDRNGVEAALLAHAHELDTVKQLGEPALCLPDLVPLFGAQWSKKLLIKLLTRAHGELKFSNGQWAEGMGDRSTEELARKIAAGYPDRLAWPQWTLACSPAAGDLYFRMRTKFPNWKRVTDMDDFESHTCDDAAVFALFNLFLEGKVEQAKAFANAEAGGLGYVLQSVAQPSMVTSWQRTGRLRAFVDFVGDLAADRGNDRLARCYVTLAQTGVDPHRYEATLRRILARATDTNGLVMIRSELEKILLREGRFREAANPVPATVEVGVNMYAESPELVRVLGMRLKRADLIQRANELDKHVAWFPGGIPGSGGDPLTEKELVEQLAAASDNHLQSPITYQAARIALTEFYFRRGRYGDVVKLLDNDSGWESPDLATPSQSFHFEAKQYFEFAESLARVGRRAEAIRIAAYAMRRFPTDDRLGELLLRLDRRGAVSRFAALAREYPGLAHPAMWYAASLEGLGRRADAEIEAHRAIALDPNDVEEWGEATRFKPSELLAEIRGQSATRFAEAGAQLSEAAADDRFELFQDSGSCYRRALALIPSDFLTHLRLAQNERLLDRLSESARELALAARCVPSKIPFPRDLDFEFFMQPEARPALRSALESVATGSRNPGICALLGEIHRMDGDGTEAIRSYARAVKLDPDCDIAWRGLARFADRLSADLSARLTKRLPSLRDWDWYYPLLPVRDYRNYWLYAAKLVARKPPLPLTVFPLAACRTRLARTRDDPFIQAREGQEWQTGFGPPGYRIASDPLITDIVSWIGSTQVIDAMSRLMDRG